MCRCIIMILIPLFAISLIAGCGQNPSQEKGGQKDVVAKQESAVTENAEEDIAEEKAESEEAPVVATSGAVSSPAAEPAAAKPSEELIVADFNTGEKPSNLGGNFGAWNKDPSDPTQWCKEGFDNVTRHGDAGFSMKLDYSVDSPNPAYNGFWMMLPNLDVTKYDTLSFWVKGDSNTGYTTVLKIEIKNANKQVGRYYVSNISDQWKEISIPLSELRGLIDRTSLTEFVVVFEDRMATKKKGVIYIDDIKFTRK